MKYQGSCHCGAVSFSVEAEDKLTAYECNCSICHQVGFQHLIVDKQAFTLLSGKENITTYQFGSKVARHTFCAICGVKPFYTPRSHPDGISVNVRCLEPKQIKNLQLIPFDGQNWDSSVQTHF